RLREAKKTSICRLFRRNARFGECCRRVLHSHNNFGGDCNELRALERRWWPQKHGPSAEGNWANRMDGMPIRHAADMKKAAARALRP
ncbi:MAG: hypothetical protein Q7U92_07550, partial [Bradyrhizobium sp.]|nr:hypothetical protein [Bradyrhizobium sp.]